MAQIAVWLKSFAFVALVTLGAVGAPKPAGTERASAPPLSENAKKHFKAGIAYVDDPGGAKWEEAYREFLAAYADTPSWMLKNNIGLCALNLERDGEAIAAYREYLAGGGEPDLKPKARQQIQTDIETLSASLVKVEVQTEPAETNIVDERKTTNGTLVVNNYPVTGGKITLGLHPGRHKLTAEAPGAVADEWVFDATPGSTHSYAFKLAPAKQADNTSPAAPMLAPVTTSQVAFDPRREQPRRTPTAVYVGAVATGVFAAAATVTGLMTLSKEKAYEDAPTDAEADRAAKTGKTLRLVTDIEIGAAILSAGATAYFYFTAPTESSSRAASKVRFRWSPTASPNAAGMSVFGSF